MPNAQRTAYKIIRKSGAFYYRWPADDETVSLVGPFSSHKEAEAAVMKQIEAILAESVKEALGIN